MNLYLIRHGRQNCTRCNVNVPLDNAGVKQANLVGSRLKNYKIDAIYSSNLIRAAQTAEIINSYLKCPYEKTENLREISFGKLEGLTDEEIQLQYGDFIKERDSLEADIPYPGGESGLDVYNRAMSIIENITNTQAQNVAIVTHGGLIRSLLAGILRTGFQNKLLFAKDLENCSITHVIYREREHRFILERFNDFAHLEHNKELLRRNFKKGL